MEKRTLITSGFVLVLLVSLLIAVFVFSYDGSLTSTSEPGNVSEEAAYENIQAAQAGARDSGRKSIIASLAVEIESLFVMEYMYPESLEFGSGNVQVGDSEPIELTEYLMPGDFTSETQSAYCYKEIEGGYKLGVLLESGAIYNAASASAECELVDFER